jgi:hypothetical protein
VACRPDVPQGYLRIFVWTRSWIDRRIQRGPVAGASERSAEALSSANLDLPSYLETRFPPLSWPQIAWHAPFYRWPIALRFDLRGTRHDLAVVYARAIALYEAAFAPEEHCVVAGGRFVARIQTATRPRDLFSFDAEQGRRLGDSLQRKEVLVESTDPDDAGAWVLQWVCRPARLFGHQRIIKGIANCDHLVEPWIEDRVYFLAPAKGLLFHMYDHRGLDIVAEDRATLAPIYRKFNDWLLDYDRPRMCETFRDLPA